MAATGTRGLTGEELDRIRAGVESGRKPKVMFTESAGQIAGQIGQVVALTDPAESDEWVVVRFGRDELPFSPGDLQVPPRGATGRKVAAPAPPVSPPPPPLAPEFVIDKPVGAASARRGAKSAVPGQAAGVSAAAATPPASGDSSASASSAPGASGSGASGASGRASSGRAPAASAAAAVPAPRKAKPKPKSSPGLTVTLAYTEGEWTVAAAQGAKVLARPYMIKPAEAMRMVALVEVPGVQEAVEQIVAAERAEAEQEAEKLRAQLAEVESRLAELRDVGP